MEIRNVLRYILFISFCVLASPSLVISKTNINSALNIKWETNTKALPFSSPSAKVGGILKTYLPNFPLTFRIYGPNSNGYFARWNRISCSFTLVSMHPETLEYIPLLASHWYIAPDHKTVYFKLDKRVKWEDSNSVRADDYVFAYKTMLNKNLRSPFSRKYYTERIKSVEKIDNYTIKIVAKYKSWRILHELDLAPLPSHKMKVDKNWVIRTNWEAPLCVGPYKINKYKRGQYVRFKRVNNWWGDKHKFLKGLYNFKYIDIKIIRNEKLALEYLKRNKLSYFTATSAVMWEKETNFELIQKGKIIKKEIPTKAPEFKYGIAFNVKKPIVNNKHFRKALAYLFDFNKINKNLMYGKYQRINSFWGETEYENKQIKAYPFNPKKAVVELKHAGYTKRAKDGILINNNGERASFALKYASQKLTRTLDIYKEDLKAYGVEMKLKLLDPAKAFKDQLDKNFQASLFARSAGIYPAPEQYLHSFYANKKNNNNVFAISNKKIDKLINIYQTNMSFKKRKTAMYKLEEIIHDEAFYLPFWTFKYIRLLYSNKLDSIQKLEPTHSSSFNEYGTWFFKE